MRLFPAPSVPWLLGHELRLAFRTTAKGNKLIWIIGACVLLGLTMAAGVPLALAIQHVRLEPTPVIAAVVDGSALVLLTLMLSQTMAMSTQAFYDRGDLDLLLSSPVPPSRLLVVRCFAIAFSACALYLALASPFLLPVAALGHWPVLAAYGVVGGLGLTAAALGLVLAMALFAWIGPRRTKTVGQVLAAFIGAIVFLASQIGNLLPNQGRDAAHWIARTVPLSLFGPDSPLSWPARAMLGEPLPFFVLFGAALLFFVWVVQSLGARFAVNASIATGSDARRRIDRRAVGRFRRGVTRALVRKELKLIARDPALLSQVLLRLLYYIPLAVVLARNARFGSAMLIAGSAGAVVFFAGQIASSLAWITISAEDTPDLIRSAPVKPSRARRAKMIAALLPVVALACVPVGVLAWYQPWAGGMTAIGVIACSLSAGLVNLWYGKPQPRSAFRRRGGAGGGSLMASLGDFFIEIGWSAATGMAVMRSPFAAAVVVIPLGILGVLSAGRNRDGAA